MKLYEFLEKIENCGQEFSIELRKKRFKGLFKGLIVSRLTIEIRVKNYDLSIKYVEYPDKSLGERKFTDSQDFTEDFAEIEKFIKKSLAKVAIDEQ